MRIRNLKILVWVSENGKYKLIEFASLETEKKRANYIITNCIQKKNQNYATIKTINTNNP